MAFHHISVTVHFNAFRFVPKSMGGGVFWPYAWRCVTFKADGQFNMIQLTKSSVSVLIHTQAREKTFVVIFFVLHRTGEIYWMKSETFTASAKIKVRASNPEIKQRNEFWILWVKKSISSSIWFICPNCWQYALHAWISQEHVLIIFHICMYVKQWRVCFCTIEFCYKFLHSKFFCNSFCFSPKSHISHYFIAKKLWKHKN